MCTGRQGTFEALQPRAIGVTGKKIQRREVREINAVVVFVVVVSSSKRLKVSSVTVSRGDKIKVQSVTYCSESTGTFQGDGYGAGAGGLIFAPGSSRGRICSQKRFSSAWKKPRAWPIGRFDAVARGSSIKEPSFSFQIDSRMRENEKQRERESDVLPSSTIPPPTTLPSDSRFRYSCAPVFF